MAIQYAVAVLTEDIFIQGKGDGKDKAALCTP